MLLTHKPAHPRERPALRAFIETHTNISYTNLIIHLLRQTSRAQRTQQRVRWVQSPARVRRLVRKQHWAF